MKDYAVIKINHRQYIVQEGKTYSVDKFMAEPGSKLDLEVLAVGHDEELLATPDETSKAVVKVEVLGQELGKKIKTFIYRAKSRYHKSHGFRQQVTRFKVLKIL